MVVIVDGVRSVCVCERGVVVLVVAVAGWGER